MRVFGLVLRAVCGYYYGQRLGLYLHLRLIWRVGGLNYWIGAHHGVHAGNILVAVAWSNYFTGLLDTVGLRLSHWVTMGTQSAHASYEAVLTLLRAGRPLAAATPTQFEAY
jgi:hypothetical protein